MNYIYCYENKINHHKYIGQTNNLKVRYSAHKSQSFNPNSKDYFCLFHKKIREYGLENFDFYVLEEIVDKDQDYVDFRERFWIEQLKTWCRYGQGYNENSGGQRYKKSLPLTDEEGLEIKRLLKETETSITDIAKQYNTYRDCISYINKGIYFYDENEFYPLRVTRNWREVPQEIKEQIALEILNSKTALKDIAKKYLISEHLINQINNGESNLKGEYNYPLRKTNKKLTQSQEDFIYQKLCEGAKCCDIANDLGVSRGTIEKRKKKYGF